jgi:NADPH:quinone reductase
MRVRPGQTPPEARTGGGDAAGEVVEIGRDVSGIKLGDRVMGRCAGGFAEFALVVDNIGADVLAPCFDALAVGGRFVTIGRMSGVTKGELDVDRLAERRLHLYGVSNRLRTPAQRAETAKRFAADLLPALGDGRLRPVIDRCFPLDQIAAAGAWLEADKHVGKVVIEP